MSRKLIKEANVAKGFLFNSRDEGLEVVSERLHKSLCTYYFLQLTGLDFTLTELDTDL